MKTKMPSRYYQKCREVRRERRIQLAHRLGGVSRHEEDPDGSAFWVENGYWPTPAQLSTWGEAHGGR